MHQSYPGLFTSICLLNVKLFPIDKSIPSVQLDYTQYQFCCKCIWFCNYLFSKYISHGTAYNVFVFVFYFSAAFLKVLETTCTLSTIDWWFKMHLILYIAGKLKKGFTQNNFIIRVHACIGQMLRSKLCL